ncbi:MAG: type II toxin-antitoxin system ParD family antitoxin [Candidatus Hydrogenedentes bacterium]|nr:type II toxin-antitoxin system ParD family antitoxin [Candidatus Hydrogenedentota bacterium]
MNISLSKGLEAFAQAKVDSGDYSSISEVVREGVRLLKKKEEEEESDRLKFLELKALLAKGLEDAAGGRVSAFDLDRIRAMARRKLDDQAQ